VALPKYEDWKAPWEEKGEAIDPERVKKHLHNLLSDKERLQASVATLTGERDAAQAKVTETERKELTETDRLKAELEDLKKGPKPDPLELKRYQLGLKHGLSESQVKRLVGTTPEELEADVEVLRADLGKPEKDPPGGGRRLKTGQEGELPDDNDPAKFAALFKQ
jgi:hypothetical protein